MARATSKTPEAGADLFRGARCATLLGERGGFDLPDDIGGKWQAVETPFVPQVAAE